MVPPKQAVPGQSILPAFNALVAAVNWLIQRQKPLRVAGALAQDRDGTLRVPTFINFVQGAAIAARSGSSVSSGSCSILKFNGTGTLAVDTPTLKVFNPWTTAVPSGSYVLVVRAFGVWWAAMWDGC